MGKYVSDDPRPDQVELQCGNHWNADRSGDGPQLCHRCQRCHVIDECHTSRPRNHGKMMVECWLNGILWELASGKRLQKRWNITIIIGKSWENDGFMGFMGF